MRYTIEKIRHKMANFELYLSDEFTYFHNFNKSALDDTLKGDNGIEKETR